jgi:hypothetical protein
MVINAGLDRMPNNESLLYQKAEVVGVEVGREAEAIELLEGLQSDARHVTRTNEQKFRLLAKINELQSRIGATSEVLSENIQQQIAIAPDDMETANSIAWQLYTLNERLDLAEAKARRARDLGPNDVNVLQTLLAILVRRRKWDDAKILLEKWIAYTSPQQLRQGWHSYLPLFADISRFGWAGEASALMIGRLHEADWKALHFALAEEQESQKHSATMGGESTLLAMRLRGQINEHRDGHRPQRHLSWPED